MENNVIKTQDYLNHFDYSFNATAPTCFGGVLDGDGLLSLKEELSKVVANFSEKVGLVNSLTRSNTSADLMSAIAGPIEHSLNQKGVNFSSNLGGLYDQNISTMILSTYYQSYTLSYVFDTVGMETQKTLYQYQLLNSQNSFGVYQPGDAIMDPRTSPHPMAQVIGTNISTLEKEISGDTPTGPVQFERPVRMNSVVVKAYKSDINDWVVIGNDRPTGYRDGVIALTEQGFCKSMKIDYRKGEITIGTPSSASGSNITKFKFEAQYDYTLDSKETANAVISSRIETAELEAMAYSFVLEQNIEDIVHMNKVNSVNKIGNSSADYARNTINQAMSLITRNIDVNNMDLLVREFLPYLSSVNDLGLPSLAGWQDAGNTNLFETRIQAILSFLDVNMSERADNRTPTALLVDSTGANTLMTSRLFVRANQFSNSADGFIGTYNGLPIIRSRVLDWYFSPKYKSKNPLNVSDKIAANIGIDGSSDTFSVMFAVHKDVTNKTACGQFGFYLPPYVTATQPMNNGNIIRHSVSMEYANKILLPNLALPIIVRCSGIPSYTLPNNPFDATIRR